MSTPTFDAGSNPIAPRRSNVVGVVAFVTAFALLVAAILIFLPGRYPVYLVNGLDRAYSVSVAGEVERLEPWSAKRIKVGRRGTVTAEAPELGVEAIALAVDVPFWRSFHEPPTLVINPDRVAVLTWEEVEYAEKPGDGSDLDSRSYGGRETYRLPAVDYAFVESPDEITLYGGATREVRTALSVESDLSPLSAYYMLPDEGDDPDDLAYLRQASRWFPDDEEVPHLLARRLEIDAFEPLAAPHLGRRPVAIQWHRAYQAAMSAADRDAELLADYRERLAAEPDSAEVSYLLGRIVADFGEAEALYLRALALDPELALAHGALAYRRLSVARFAEALDAAEKALALEPDRSVFTTHRETALHGLRRYEALLADARSAYEASEGTVWDTAREVLLLRALGRTEEAVDALDAFIARQAAADDAEYGEYWRPYLEGLVAYARGDLGGYVEKLAGYSDHGWAAFESALLGGSAGETAETLEAWEPEDPNHHLLAALKAEQEGNEVLAAGQRDVAVELLMREGREERVLARALAGEPVPIAELLQLDLAVDRKAIALALLGRRRSSPALRDLARELNVGLDVPRRFLAAELARPVGARSRPSG